MDPHIKDPTDKADFPCHAFGVFLMITKECFFFLNKYDNEFKTIAECLVGLLLLTDLRVPLKHVGPNSPTVGGVGGERDPCVHVCVCEN